VLNPLVSYAFVIKSAASVAVASGNVKVAGGRIFRFLKAGGRGSRHWGDTLEKQAETPLNGSFGQSARTLTMRAASIARTDHNPFQQIALQRSGCTNSRTRLLPAI